MCKHYYQEESRPCHWKRHANYCWGNSFAGIPDGSFNLQVWCHCSRLRHFDTQSVFLLGLGLVLSICRRIFLGKLRECHLSSRMLLFTYWLPRSMWPWSNEWWSMCYCRWFLPGHEQVDQHQEHEDLRRLQGQHWKEEHDTYLEDLWSTLRILRVQCPGHEAVRSWPRVSDHSFMLMSSCLGRSQEFRLPVHAS